MINLIILRVALVIDQTKTAQREVIKGVAQSEFDPFRIQTQMKIMYSNSTMVGTKKPRPSSGYLARPRLGILKNLYSGRPISTPTQEKKKRSKKSAVPRMEFRKKPDYADTAYREAVSRLRILLAESYTPIRRSYRDIDSAGEETDNQSIISVESKVSRPRRYYPPYYPPIISKKYYYPHFKTSLNTTTATIPDKNNDEPPKYENSSAPPEILSYLEQQDDYIDQLEKESRFCKSELSSLLSKVKEVINENEVLHEKQKTKFLKSVFDELEPDTETTETETEFKKKQSKSPSKKKKPTFEAPSIVFESRISELEAQLTQAKIDLRKAQEENESYKRKIADGTIILDGVGTESYKRQIENLQREKNQLQESVAKLENAITKLKYKENDSTDAVKRSLDAAEHAQYEKNAAEMEIRRLKDELERQHSKLRDAIADQSRRISEERGAVERRYTQQIEQLTTELGVQWETTNKLQMELDKQRRENGDLRRECAQKQALIDELKKDMQSKIITLQSDIGVTGAEKSALEQQISSLQLANERNERHYKQEIARLQAELQSLRQRSDRADADLIHSRRENLRLNEQLASLEKEMKLNAALSEESTRRPAHPADSIALPSPTQKKEDREELGSLIHDLESKHEATVAELEGKIKTQNQLMDKLSAECQALTVKLEDVNAKHKEEIRELQTSLSLLNSRFTMSERPSYKSEDERSHSAGNAQEYREKSEEPMTNQQSQEENHEPGKPTEQEHPQYQKELTDEPKVHNPEEQETPPVDTQQTIPEQSEVQYTEYDPNTEQQYDQQYASEDQYNQQQYDPNYQYDPNTGYQTGPNGEYITDPNQQYDQYSYENQHYQNDPNQDYPEGMVEQYQSDPNQQFAAETYDQNPDPNQQYTGDTVPVDSTQH
ncbi:serologically defined colon cancer antigen 8 homolog isoform X2 [Coccinella septempunctata]|uniref:serologically defined colon cancer antigen 8 homolog isoform X2 n=1 Tax=Coccinella septempunctata TaxID=41139 RepID=UPI001D066E2C|nr:serologically defined colon cancer antigen 8 homolog isoform X2 [Coccinella septempunctata]